MDEKIEIKKQDFYEMMYLMEKILYIAERAGSREDSDNNAYSLAITFGKENVVQELLSLRRNMNRYLDDQGEAELEKILEPIDDITIPYGLTLEALRKELTPYLPKKVEGQNRYNNNRNLIRSLLLYVVRGLSIYGFCICNLVFFLFKSTRKEKLNLL